MENKSLQEKKEILENAKCILKQEFIGLDAIIQTIIDSISSWYLFPYLQDRPFIVNLWGLTGVGKSSLVYRLSQLLNYDKRYYRFDLGSGNDSAWDIRMKLQDIAHNQNGQPMILGFDEFQHAKSLDELQRELSETPHRIIWDVLDSGKFNVTKYGTAISKLFSLKENLKYALQLGVKAEKGYVIEMKEKFIDLLDLTYRRSTYYGEGREKEVTYDTKELMIVDTEYAEIIYELWSERFKNEFEVREELMKLDGPQSIEFLEKAIELGLSPLEVDCSKALIFIMGNLDEAYHMNNDFNPDINANEFYEQSLKINISIIKNALRRRFRSEQIARLGNLHIIYPSFSQESYYKVIDLELQRLKKKHENLLGIKICFDDSVNDIIYKEGVYPTQGIRPLLTTINYLIGSQMVKIHFKKLDNLLADEVYIKEEEAHLIFKYIKNGICYEVQKEKLELNLEKLRANRKDDIQAIVAVHEAGHIVLSIALMHKIPEYAFSVTADSDSGGFMYANPKTPYISKNQIVKKAAVYLGGLLAEELVFGQDNITNGAENDLFVATRFVSNLINNSGMGKFLASINVRDVLNSYYLFEENVESNKEVLKVLEAASSLAKETLLKEKQLLLKISDYLSENSMIKKDQIIKLAKNYSSEIDLNSVLADSELFEYRNHLKQQIAKINQSQIDFKVPAICLNKNINK